MLPPRIAIALVLAVLAPRALCAEDTPWRHDLREAIAAAQTEPPRPMALLFSSESCVWCQRMIADSRAPQVRRVLDEVVGVEVMVGEWPELAERFGVRAFPSLILINRRGEFVRSISGYLPPDELVTTLRVLSLHGDEEGVHPAELAVIDRLQTALDSPDPVRELIALLGSGGAEQRLTVRRLLAERPESGALLWPVLEAAELGPRVDASAVLARWHGPSRHYDPFASAADERAAGARRWRLDSEEAPHEIP